MTTLTKLPTLFKKSSTGKLLSWEIEVSESNITIKHGQVGGKIQVETDTIDAGKNLGRANATTPAEQAMSEATARWRKQQDRKGYVESSEDALKGIRKTEAPVPMLAHKAADHLAKIKFPAYAQPKLDGHRCVAVVESSGEVTLYSRTGDVITSVPHINAELARLLPFTDIVLDGELYRHDYREDFEHLTHIIKQKKAPAVDHELVQYHVYDVMMEVDYSSRMQHLASSLPNTSPTGTVQLVETIPVGKDDWRDQYERFMDLGYEGAMLRNASGPYESKRSYNLQKVKEMQDAEFEIVGVKPGEKSKMKKCGIFICKLNDSDATFDCTMNGELKSLEEYLQHPEKYIGRKLTVQFQNYTKGQKPRFPKGIRFFQEV